MLVVVILLVVAGISKGVVYTLSFHYEESVFSRFNNYQWWCPLVSWKNKYNEKLLKQGILKERFIGSTTVFVWITDAWHLFNTIMYLSFISAISVCLTNDIVEMIVYTIVGMIVLLASFEVCYRVFKINS